MLLGFKKRFEPFILNHTKRHTIRARRKVRPKAGDTCHCYVGLRQKGAKLLGRFKCTRVQEIRIWFEPEGIAYKLAIAVDGLRLSDDEVREMAYADGFRDRGPAMADTLMGAFWEHEHGLSMGDVFIGDLIHWDPRE